MTNLQNPNLPAHAIVATREDTVLLNDGTKLKRADRNPWYVLMTIWGEPLGQYMNFGRQRKNRDTFNRWCWGSLPDDEKAELRETAGLKDSDLAPLSAEELDAVTEAFHARLGPDAKLPRPQASFNLAKTAFTVPLSLSGMILNVGSLAGAQFFMRVEAKKTNFRKYAAFEGAIFHDTVDFSDSWFTGAAVFSDAVFHKTSVFTRAKMQRSASFVRAEFKEGAVFSEVQIEEWANFTEARFHHFANFVNAAFKWRDWSSFNKASFEDSANFSRARFEGDMNFIGAEFKSGLNLQKAIFARRADFSSALIERHLWCNRTSFCTEFPKLNATLLPKTIQVFAEDEGEVELDDDSTEFRRFWPPLHQIDPKEWRQARGMAALLRHSMTGQALPEEEHFFFRKEMWFNARIGSVWHWLPYRAFEVVSDFGYSIWRPFAFLFGAYLIPAMILMVTFEWGCFRGADWCEGAPNPLGLSFANTFGFFGFHRLYFAEFLRDAPAWMVFLFGVQTVLGFVFLFFLGLGLRTRFRMR